MVIAQSWCRCAMGEPSPGGRQRLRPEPFRQISLHTCSTNPLAARRAEPPPPAHTHESIPGRASIATNALQSRRAESGTQCTAQIVQHAARNMQRATAAKTCTMLGGRRSVRKTQKRRETCAGKGARLKAGVCRDDCYRSVAGAVIRKQLRNQELPQILTARFTASTCSAAPEQSWRWATLAPIVHAQNERSLAVMATVVHVLHESFHGMSSNGAQSSRAEVRLPQRARVYCVGCVHLRSARVRATVFTCVCVHACVGG